MRSPMRSVAVKRFGSVAVAGVVLVAMAGCSGSEAKVEDPTKSASPQSSTSAPTDGESVAAGGDQCAEKKADDDVEVSFGEMAAASDEWAAEMGRQWRHYYPLTVTNVSDETCLFIVSVAAHFDKRPSQYEDVSISLEPGQTYTAQVFELEGSVDFTDDSEAATPTKPVEIEYNGSTKRLPLPDYYDADITFGEIEGSGGETVLPVTITINGVADGQPERAASSPDDILFVNGLDAQGNVVAATSIKIEPVIESGETRVINMPLGGGTSSGTRMVLNPVSDFLKAVSFEVVEFKPTAIKRK